MYINPFNPQGIVEDRFSPYYYYFLKWVCYIVCKLYLNKVNLQRKYICFFCYKYLTVMGNLEKKENKISYSCLLFSSQIINIKILVYLLHLFSTLSPHFTD